MNRAGREADGVPVIRDPEQQRVDDLDIQDSKLIAVQPAGGQKAAFLGKQLCQNQLTGLIRVKDRIDPGMQKSERRPDAEKQRDSHESLYCYFISSAHARLLLSTPLRFRRFCHHSGSPFPWVQTDSVSRRFFIPGRRIGI